MELAARREKKPQGKPSLPHQQILGAMLKNKPGTLANNVQEEQIDRMARRWTP